MFSDIYAPYHPLESWFYDSAVAPVISESIDMNNDLQFQFMRSMPETARILDVGCGGGHLAASLAGRHPGWRITGVDLSVHQVRRALKRCGVLDEQTRFVAGSALALPFRSGSFDGLISVCAIKHWPEPARGLAECLRVLRPGGTLAILEVDRNRGGDDERAFVARQRVPFFLKPFALAGFKWKVAARSLTMDEGVELFKGTAAAIRTYTMPGMPLWMIIARKGTIQVTSQGVNE
ncbi:MAG: class I SAM-dependent methyltransferase [Spirochaetes bacterium]|nr:class I SAM-dependent methyltransferase [Spirochaetota bacterium]